MTHSLHWAKSQGGEDGPLKIQCTPFEEVALWVQRLQGGNCLHQTNTFIVNFNPPPPLPPHTDFSHPFKQCHTSGRGWDVQLFKDKKDASIGNDIV